MSIFNRTGEPPPFDSLARRLSLFADREELTRLFLGKLNEGDTAPRILFLHGMGGNGKSLLLRYLQARCSIQFESTQWQSIANDPLSTVLALHEAGEGKPVANALIDFGARPVGQQRPLEALPGLFIVKRQLAEYRIKTPRFDFAAVNYLQKSGLAYRQVLPELFPASELDLAMTIADFLSGLPLVSAGRAILKIFEERTNDALARWKLAKAIEKEHVARIIEAPADPVLADLLPYYFAADLNAALTPTGPRSRIALFCDTHEAFWGEDAFPTAGIISLAALARDKWLRILLGNLDLEHGVVLVVAGRKPPRWSRAEEAAIPDECIDLRHITGLTPADARWYLEHIGITDAAVQNLVISYASGSPGEVHPYMLGLCTDVIASQGSGGLIDSGARSHVEAGLEVRRRRLVARLMSSVSEDMQRQVVAVAACRSFDYACFEFLARRLGFVASRDAYVRLVNFSFILETSDSAASGVDPAGSVFAVHQLLRRELEAMFRDESVGAHAALVEFYGSKSDAASIAEAVLHRSYVDRAAGTALWCETMDSYLTTGRYGECQALIGVVPDMPVPAAEKTGAFYYRVARAYLGVGAVAEAEALCQQLEPGSVEAILLQADIRFYRCEFEAAELTARQGLATMTGSDHDRLQLRLAEILLYRGQFAAAREALSGFLQGAEAGRADAGLAWSMLAGEVALFAGKIAESEQRFRECRDGLNARPERERDVTIRAWNLADRGLIHIVKQEWDEAFADAATALGVRETASHARGVANSLYLMGCARCGAGLHEEGRVHLGRAGKLARDQGDEVTLVKIRQAEAMSRFATTDVPGAIELLGEALDGTAKWGVPYDRAHVLLDMAVLRRAVGEHRAMVTALDEARAILAHHEFGLLEHLYPDLTMPPADRIRSGLVSFAAGDALGAPWEGSPPGQIAFAPTDPLPRRDDWPAGSTTDDTDQVLVAAEALVAPAADLPRRFLSALAAILPSVRGLGPTTPEAVARFLRTDEVATDRGSTNGGVVRALVVGWAMPASRSGRRRELTEQLTRTTHGSAEALVSAHLVAAMGSWSVEGVGGGALADVALSELDDVLADYTLALERETVIRSAAQANWEPPPEGVPMQAADTVAAAIAVLRRTSDPVEAMLASLRLGGDTDSVAALVGGLLGASEAGQSQRIPWLPQVRLPASRRIEEVAGALARYRSVQYE